jgi:hypothetical protein
MGDRLVAETSDWQHTALSTERHLFPRPDSNLQCQDANGRRCTSHSAATGIGRHVSCFQCQAVLILACGTSLCLTIRNQNNLAQRTEFLHWQAALFTNKQTVSTVSNKVRWLHTTNSVDCVQQGTMVTYNKQA